MEAVTRTGRWLRQQPAWRWVAGLIVLGLIAVYYRGAHVPADLGLTFEARRGPLDISVLEGGSIEAEESQEIKCEVRVGYQGVKILKIVEEGYQVSEEDVRTNKVLVELDSSDIEKQLVQQEIQYQSAAASLTEAQQAYEIQLNQNLSDIKAAEQKAKFARMDFDKYLGADAAGEIVAQLGIDSTNGAATAAGLELPDAPIPDAPTTADHRVQVTVPAPGSAAAIPAVSSAMDAAGMSALLAAMESPTALELPGGTPEPAATDNGSSAEASLDVDMYASLPSVFLDFSKYADIDKLGDGEAKQKLRELKDALQVAQKETQQAASKLEGTRRLFEKGFVTQIELQQDELAHENNVLKVQKSATALDLYLAYEFSKAAQEFLSKYEEAVRELVRARKTAVSRLAQARAKLRSAQGQYAIQERQLNELKEQLSKCVIRAEKPGLVVYGSGGEERFWRGEEEIREGATVRERQSIITIPDMTRMTAVVKIDESYIKKIKKEQKARITLDAFPDEVLTGEVTKVGVLPDSGDRWMNPDLKVYRTEIAIDGTHNWLKPGMSAKVEIFVDRLEDVVYVPIQAVVPQDDQQVCYVANGGRPEARVIESGQFNDEFIEVKTGIAQGDQVLLKPPVSEQPKASTSPEIEPELGQTG